MLMCDLLIWIPDIPKQTVPILVYSRELVVAAEPKVIEAPIVQTKFLKNASTASKKVDDVDLRF